MITISKRRPDRSRVGCTVLCAGVTLKGNGMSDDFLVHDFFEDRLTTKIVSEVLRTKVGERLPSERDLSRELNVSRTALRDRLRYLEAVGLLERRSGMGTVLKELHPKVVSQVLILGFMTSGMTVSSLTPVRIALERQAARAAAIENDPIRIAHIESAVRAMEVSSDPQSVFQADVAFHEAVSLASNSRALIFFSDVLSGVISRSVRQRQERILQLCYDKERIRSLHRTIYQEVARGNAEGAMTAMDEHFHYLDELQGISGITNGRV